ncbi:hypothetical protein CROQUDRAFT_657967 [Cronartium quercuum f. sp. fusiforme G11]|uniref:Uncharacterized protein n=1 Tax=Cronartium quercuum f. sp. fusiforme G11 TaxID=708437 RepID=A0A9P6NM26_9BASI|nr:hypothetical protein CROQUDRAFT_657967 [Cronartium quercuum f. sp. fusiforme G11]
MPCLRFYLFWIPALCTLLLNLSISADPSPSSLCLRSETIDNPIASTYPTSVTGVLNGTLAILPIPLSQAQSLVGSKHKILTEAYRKLLPDFPSDMYPALLQALRDHDVQTLGIPIPDFSRISIEFPFVDLLGDSYSSFRYVPAQAITATQLVAVGGSRAYGTKVVLATFDPSCEAYKSDSADTTSLVANSLDGRTVASTKFQTDNSVSVSNLLKVFQNITNQPIYVREGGTCDHMLRLFNTSASLNPVGVIGQVKIEESLFSVPGGGVFNQVQGLRMATSFIEENGVSCNKLKGYSGTGSGD